MAPTSAIDFASLKESGNALFKQGKFQDALDLYSQALALVAVDQDKSAVLKNQAACYLKLENYEKCNAVSSQALELSPNDPKALFRRCQALEKLGRVDEAFKDARKAAHAEPGDASIKEALVRLKKKIDEASKKQASTDQKVTDMLNFLHTETDKEKRRLAANNLIVLAREKAGAELLVAKPQVLEKMVKLLRDPKLDAEVRLTIVRTLGEILKGDPARTREILRNRIGLPPLMALYCVDNLELVTAVSIAVENILKTLSGWLDKEKPDPAMIKANQEDIDHTLQTLTEMVDKAVLSAVGRDSIIDILLKNIPENLSPGLGWADQFMEKDGIAKLLTAAVVQPGDRLNVGSSLNVTNETRIHISLALQKINDDLDGDKKRKVFTDKCEQFVQRLLADPDPETKMLAVLVVITLLQGPFDVGNFLLGSKNILEMLLVMATSDEPEHQIIAAEAIVHAASKKDKCAAILSEGMGILKKLAKSPNDKVQVRALVGLCKAGSSGGLDFANKPLPEEEVQQLAQSCRKFLTNPAKDFDLRRWAAEGLAYLSLDGNVKDSLVEDRAALRSLIDLGKTGNQNIIYGVVSVFVNLTNSYDKPEVVPEMKELAQFAKQHVPVEHPKDSPECVAKRVEALAEEGVVSALVAVSKVESKNVRELIARVMNVVAEGKDHRGAMVQQGGAKALLALALDGTERGKECASQALARIGITIDPTMAFPGQRAYEVVRPLLALLQEEKSALQNFEALLALTNLAQVSESVRQRIVKEQGLSKIEHYLYEEHEMLKRAATECICNLMLSPDVQDIYIRLEGDRIKLLLLYMADEDVAVARAASGAIAMLSDDEKACARIIQPTMWLEVMKEISVSEHADIRLRALYIIGNLIRNSQTAAEAICQSELLEILLATSQLTGADNALAQKAALHALKAAHTKKLIAPNPEYEEDEDAE